MGSYASFDDTIHPTEAWDLAEYCTACGNTGWVEYPRTVHEIEHDPCPYGCMDAAELLDEGQEWALDHGFENQWEALTPEPLGQLDPEDLAVVSLARQRDRVGGALDPLYTLLTQVNKHSGLAPPPQTVDASHHGRVASDDYIPGFMRSGRIVKHISIPPYLVGSVMDMDDDYAHIRYEYFGSFLDVFVSRHTLSHRMRFAYSWDRSYSVHDVMG